MILVSQAFVTVTPEVGAVTSSRTGAVVEEVLTPLQTLVTVLTGDGPDVCLITSAMGVQASDVSYTIRHSAAAVLGIPMEHVLLFSTHNHCTPSLQHEPSAAYCAAARAPSADNVTALGQELVRGIAQVCEKLRARLQPVTVHWAVGHERRLTYNRKGHRADGSTFFMREEDRVRYGRDYTGDIDDDVAVVAFLDRYDEPAGFLTSFTGHPVTAYHPERMVAFGEWPQLATDRLGEYCGGVPVAFLQGCCGDVNSKRMLCGDTALSFRFGRYLGDTMVKAARRLTASVRNDLDFRAAGAKLPLAALPTGRVLEAELAEIDDFIARAKTGDENTRSCVGLNFPRCLSPAYRGQLVAAIRPWTEWALRIRREGAAADLPRALEVPMAALRIGDVGIVGMPCEPFLGIGRQIKAGSPLPLAIPCGYMNDSFGYIPDGPNCGDREYMSAFYRYTRFQAPYRRPAGDALARCGVRMLSQLTRGR